MYLFDGASCGNLTSHYEEEGLWLNDLECVADAERHPVA
jgi:hypothetical protein